MAIQRTTIALFLLTVFGVGVCIWFIAQSPRTTTESVLFSIFLTAISAIGSWVTSRYYAELSASNNLKFFARQAAEKVTNLSKQLDRCSLYLQEEVEEKEYASEREAVLAKQDRIEAAIHIIGTLKSVNDGSLSDWQGVIGDEIAEHRKEQEEQTDDLEEITERLGAINTLINSATPAGDNEGTDELRQEITSLKRDVRLLASQLGGVSFSHKTSLPPALNVEAPCPNCNKPVQYRQSPAENKISSPKCSNCGMSLVSTYADGKFLLKIRTFVSEPITCPSCSSPITVLLDPIPNNTQNFDCPKCGGRGQARRRHDRSVAVTFTERQADKPIDEEVLNRIKEAMPTQPWPHGAARTVAAMLGMHPSVVSEAIKELIKRGIFKQQIEGILYEKLESPNKTTQ